MANLEVNYKAIEPSAETLSQQLVLKENQITMKNLQRWKQELSDCSRATDQAQKYYYVIVRKDMKDPKKDQLRYVANKIADNAEEEYNQSKEENAQKFTGHSSIITEKDYKKHLAQKGAYNVIMAGSFTINRKADLNKKKTNCMTAYDNDSGHFKGKMNDLDPVAHHWGFTGQATRVNHHGNIDGAEELVLEDDLPPVMMGMGLGAVRGNVEYFDNFKYDDNEYETRSGYLSGSNYGYSNIYDYGYNYYIGQEIFLILIFVLLTSCLCVITYLLGLVCGCIGTKFVVNIILKCREYPKKHRVENESDMDSDHPI